MTPDCDGPILWQHRKARYVVTVRHRRFCGSEFLDIRDHLPGDELKPTQRGVTVPLEAVSELAAALAAFVAGKPPSAP